MSKFYTLDEISKIYGISKSKLRYWESQGLIISKRNKKNGYREYGFNELMEIGNVLFYRDLDISIQDLKKINLLSPDGIEKIIKDKKKDLKDSISDLENKISKINLNIFRIQEYNRLKKKPYIREESDINFIIYHHLESVEENNLFIQNPYNFCILFSKDNNYIYGMDVLEYNENLDKELILSKENIKDKNFITCLLEVDVRKTEETNLNYHIKNLKELNYKVGEFIFGKYLLCGVNDNGISKDFFKLWIEIQ